MHPWVVGSLFAVLIVDAYSTGRASTMWMLIIIGAVQFYDVWSKQRAIDAEIQRKHLGD